MNKSNLAVKGDEIELENTITIKEKKVIDIKTEATENKKSNIVYKFVKRVIDIIGSIIGMVILIPVTAILYIVWKRVEYSTDEQRRW